MPLMSPPMTAAGPSAIVVCLLVAGGTPLPAQRAPGADALLAAGDTVAAIAALRQSAPGAAEQCLLAALLTARATSASADWRLRLEARELLDRSLRARPDPECFLVYSALLEKQGVRIDAARMADRALALLRDRPDAAPPAALAEAYYRRTIPLADWVRNFDHLVVVRDLPVSTGDCVTTVGVFCEALEHPWAFFERLRRGTPVEELVAGARARLVTLLDSALALAPSHGGALRSALRDAGAARDWNRFARLADRARAAAPLEIEPLLALITAHRMRGDQDRAAALFDTLSSRLSPDARVRLEGLDLVADSTLAERLRGPDAAAYAEAVWALSDPLYLTEANERRVEHYVRVYLAGLLFGDPMGGLDGRDTDQGRLLIRYGIPSHWFAVAADRSLELMQAQKDLALELGNCATLPSYQVQDGIAGLNWLPVHCPIPESTAYGIDAGGRWIYWFYDSAAVPFIFERALGSRVARHKFETQSRAIDAVAARAVPSSYRPSFRPGTLRTLLTRFPRPDSPVVEVHGRFDWGSTADSVSLGIFVHDRVSGALVRRGRSHGVGSGTAPLQAELGVPWGRFRFAVEGYAAGADAGAQLRAAVDLLPPAAAALTLSDLLLGDSASAPGALTRRDDVRFHARPDSLYGRSARLAVYWEVYGLRPAGPPARGGGSAAPVRYRVRVRMDDAGGRPVASRLVRALGAVLGVRRTHDFALEWEITREISGIAAEVLELEAPDDDGLYHLTVEVTDLSDNRVARASRVLELVSPK